MSDIFRSPNGKIIAIGIGQILHWFDAVTFKEIGSLPLQLYRIAAIDFSPDSQLIGVESGLSEAQIVDLNRSKVLATFQGGNGPIWDLVFTPDNQYVAFVIGDMTSGGSYDSIGLWNISADKGERAFDVIHSDQSHGLSAPAISPDGKLVAAGSTDSRVYIWDLYSGQTRFALEGHMADVTSVDFSPDGKWLASGSRDRTVRLWNPVTGTLVRVITGMTDEVSQVKFSSDGQQLEIGNWLRPTHTWDLDAKELRSIDSQVVTPDPFAAGMHRQGFSQSAFPNNSNEVLLSLDGRSLAIGSEPVLLWDLMTQTVTTSLEGVSPQFITDMRYSPDGRHLAAVDNLGNLSVWDTRTGQKLIRREGGFFSGIGSQSGVQAFVFSPNSTLLALASKDIIEIWDVASASQVTAMKLNQGTRSANNLAFSSDGSQLYIVLYLDHNEAAEVWEVGTGKLLRHFELPAADPSVFGATDLNWPYFARNNADQGNSWIELWNLETEQVVRLKTPGSETAPIRFSPDGSLLTAVSDLKLYTWKTATGQLLYVSQQTFENPGLAISPDNQTLATGFGGQATLWDISRIARINGSP